MDIQNKLEIHIGEHSPNDRSIIIDLDNLGSASVLFSFCENDHVFLLKKSDFYSVEVEVGEDISNSFSAEVSDKPLIINSRESQHPCLNYQIKITGSNGHTETRLYSIRHLNSIKDNQFKSMVNYIAEKNVNLLFNVDESKKNGSYREKDLSDFLYKSKEICANYQKIEFCVNEILKNPDCSLNRSVTLSPLYKKQNSKTIIANAKNNVSNKFFNVTTEFTYDTEDNRRLKKALGISLNKTDILIMKIKRKCDLYQEEMDKLDSLINNHEIKNIESANRKKDLLSRVIENELTNLSALRSIVSLIKLVLHSEFIDDVGESLSNKNLETYTNPIYQNLSSVLFSSIFNKNLSNYSAYLNQSFAAGTNKTSLLFEYYCFLLLNDYFETNGFHTTFDSDFLKNDEGAFCVYTDGEYRILLGYNRIIPPFDLSAEETNDFYAPKVNTETNFHNRPDFTLSLIDSTGEVIYSAVIDAKCRLFSTVKRETKAGGNLRETAYDYSSLVFKDGNNLLRTKRIDDLLFLSCGQEEIQCQDDIIGHRIITMLLDQNERNFKNFLFESIIKKVL